MDTDVPGGSVARRCAVLGSPIGHSLSPVLHRAAYAELGLDWTYDAVEVDGPGLAGFLTGLDDRWRGLSLTMPLKRTVMPLLDEADPWARVSGGANTVVLEDGRLLGHNTDVPGAVQALTEAGARDLTHAVVLGAGATAASTGLALADLGVRTIRLLARDPSRAEETAAALAADPRLAIDVLPLDGAGIVGEIVVSTIPVAAQDDALVAATCGAAVVFEVVYDPWPSPLAAAAVERGQALVSGLDLLVHQAVLQFAMFTGHNGPLDSMRAAGEQALASR